MRPELAHLLMASCLCLACFGLSALLLFRAQQRGRLQAARVDAVVGHYRSSWSPPGAGTYRLGRVLPGAGGLDRAAALIGYDRAHPEHYKVKPWVVLTGTLIVAAGLSRAASGLLGPMVWLSLPVAWVFLCRAVYRHLAERRMNTLFNQFPDALATIVRAVRVGLPVVEAIRIVARESPAPTAPEFAILVDQTTIGVALDQALRDMAQRNKLPEYRFFATALSLQSQTGGGLTETLENLADTIRKRVATRIRGHALAAEARMSSYILGALPLVAGGLLSVINPGYMGVMFTDPSGRNLLMTGIILLCLGAFSMRMLIRKSLS